MVKKIALVLFYSYLLIFGPLWINSAATQKQNLINKNPKISLYLKAKDALENTNPAFLNLDAIQKAMSVSDSNFVVQLNKYQTLSTVLETLIVVEFVSCIIGVSFTIALILEWILNR